MLKSNQKNLTIQIISGESMNTICERTGVEMLCTRPLVAHRQAKEGDKILIQTNGGGLFSGLRVLIFQNDWEAKVDLPQGSIIRFEYPVEIIGAPTPSLGGARSPGSLLEKDDLEATVSEIEAPDANGLWVLRFTRSGEAITLHYFHPGQIATVQRVGR